ncbi:DnaJ domain-containing protein [Candidatus Woesearchaeota archaeon]|nr:DnaJ domain-containing protein [Candidatus Woesearchaeota archaeon]
MTTKRDYYEILGVNKSCSKDDIKKAYKKLAKKFHPDLNKTKDAEEKFKEISEAYAVLSDDQKRTTYDQFGHSGFDQRYSQEDIFRGADFESIFRSAGFSDFGNIFDIFFGGHGERKRRRSRGNDLRYDLSISFPEAALGVEKIIEVNKFESCKHCNGTGSETKELINCKDCQGTGQKRIQRRTPFGYFTSITTCRSCGGEGLVIEKACEECGGSAQIEVEKKIKVKIPQGIESGAMLRVKSEGGPGFNGSENGDLYVVVDVESPKKLNNKQKKLYQELLKLEGKGFFGKIFE